MATAKSHSKKSRKSRKSNKKSYTLTQLRALAKKGLAAEKKAALAAAATKQAKATVRSQVAKAVAKIGGMSAAELKAALIKEGVLKQSRMTLRSKSGRKHTVRKVSKILRSKAGKIMRAIKMGKIAAQQQKRTPRDMPGVDSRTQHEMFVQKYERSLKALTKKSLAAVSQKTRKKSASKKKATRKSLKVIAQQAGVKYRVLAPRRIPARIAAIPGSKATPFRDLSSEAQAQVVNKLNSEKGRKLRAKGAPRKVSLQEMRKAVTRKTAKAAGAANRRRR